MIVGLSEFDDFLGGIAGKFQSSTQSIRFFCVTVGLRRSL